MKTSLERWLLGLILLSLIGLGGLNIYLGTVIDDQRHTIKQYMGLEAGPDATPIPPLSPEPSAPKPSQKQLDMEQVI